MVAVVLSGCAPDTATGDLQLVVADQTVENPLKDVIEITIDRDSPLYPDSAPGGSPMIVGAWTAGEPISLTLWSNASEESELSWPIDVPTEFESQTLTIVVEIGDDQVTLSGPLLNIRGTFDRTNPAEEQRQLEAAAAEEEAKAATEAAEIATEAAEAAAAAAQAEVMAVRSEAGRLSGEMTNMQTQLTDVLDEHAKVYGEDGWADFTEIERKYKDYTTDALAELQAALPSSSFDTEQVTSLDNEWHTWWRAYFNVQSRAETAARNGDSTSMDSVREDENELWIEWTSMFDRVENLTVFSIDDD